MILKNFALRCSTNIFEDNRVSLDSTLTLDNGTSKVTSAMHFSKLGYTYNSTTIGSSANVMTNNFRIYKNTGEIITSGNLQNYYSGQTILVGSSTTPATYTDYSMGSRIDGTVLESVSPPSVSNTNKNGQFIITHTLRNITSDDVTVNEIGFASGGTSTNYTYVMTNYVLWTREALSTPVVIPAGEQKTFTLTIDFNKMSTGYSAA